MHHYLSMILMPAAAQCGDNHKAGRQTRSGMNTLIPLTEDVRKDIAIARNAKPQ